MSVEYLSLKAAEKFEFGDLRGTRYILLEALQRLQELSGHDSTTKINGLQTFHEHRHFELDSSKRIMHTAPSSEEFESDEYDSLYNSLFIVNDDVPISVNEKAATLLFNVALLHHRAGIKYNDTHEYFYALEIYMKALDIFKSVGDEKCAGYSSSLVPVVAALFYNVAQVFITFFRSQQAQESFDMDKLLQSVASEENISDEDFEFFQLNLRLSRMTNFLIAPSA
jgi:hypothetical protein